jgi:hypothetical protein
MFRNPWWAFALSAWILLGGCGGGDGPAPCVVGECTEANTLCATLVAPEDFTGTPRQLMALLFAEDPPAGPPAAILSMLEDPAVGRDQCLNLEVILSITGAYYFYAALYMEGGGATEPVAGVDYVAHGTGPITADGSPINLGELTLELYQDPGP